MAVADAKSTMMDLVGAGLDSVNTTLQGLYDSGSSDLALINSLTALGSQYTFDQMRVYRAEITAIDDDPGTAAIMAQFGAACGQLAAIQANSAATTDWITKVTGALDQAMAAYAALTTPSS